jgi:hypothetical protein
MTTLLIGQSTIPTVSGEDSVNPAGLLPGNQVYAGYGAGTFADMTQIKSRFPGKKYLEITPFVGPGDCLDVETGDATPADAKPFIEQWNPVNTNKPVIYANMSTMPAVKAALVGILRSRYYLWVALWDGNPAIPPGYDGKQYASVSGYDSNTFDDVMWATEPVTYPIAPAPPGQWANAAVMTGIGTDGNLFQAVYNPATGAWSAPERII